MCKNTEERSSGRYKYLVQEAEAIRAERENVRRLKACGAPSRPCLRATVCGRYVDPEDPEDYS